MKSKVSCALAEGDGVTSAFHTVLPSALAFPQNQWMNTHLPTRLKFRGMPSELTGINQISRGLSLVFYKESRQDTSACKNRITILCTKSYCGPVRTARHPVGWCRHPSAPRQLLLY